MVVSMDTVMMNMSEPKIPIMAGGMSGDHRFVAKYYPILDHIIDFRKMSSSFRRGAYIVSLGFERTVQVDATVGLVCPALGGNTNLCTSVCLITSLLSSEISVTD